MGPPIGEPREIEKAGVRNELHRNIRIVSIHEVSDLPARRYILCDEGSRLVGQGGVRSEISNLNAPWKPNAADRHERGVYPTSQVGQTPHQRLFVLVLVDDGYR